MRDILTPARKPWDVCSVWGCHEHGDFHRRGFRYCERHYSAIVEEDWGQARKDAREKRRPRSDAAKEMRDLLDEIARAVAAREGKNDQT